MRQNVANSLDIYADSSRLPLDSTRKVVVELFLHFWSKCNVDFSLALSRYDTTDGLDYQRLAVLRFTFDALPIEVEWNGHFLQVLEVYHLFVLASNEERSEIDFACIEEDIWFNDSSHNEEILLNLL